MVTFSFESQGPQSRRLLMYDWQQDSRDSWALAIRYLALAYGSRRFQTIPEMYFQESRGAIP